MRARIAGIVAACLVVFGTVAWADSTFEGFQIVRVIFNQQEVASDVPAVNFYGRTMLPVRKIAELAGLTVDRWDEETSTVYLSGSADTARLQAENAQLKAELAQLKSTVATVNGEPISHFELYNRLVAQGGPGMIDTLIREKLVAQAARQANVTVGPAEIDREIAKIKQQVGGEQQFQQALLVNNITLQQLRDYQVFRLQATKLIAPTLPTGDADLKLFFEANKARFDSRQVHARHILVATAAEAKEIKAQLDQGADFATLAKSKSVEPAARTSGGDLGFFGLGQMVPEFERVVFSLAKGAISEPFQTQFGWHVAQVLEVKGTAPDFEAMKADVRAIYVEAKVQEQLEPWLAQLRAQAQITNSLEQ